MSCVFLINPPLQKTKLGFFLLLKVNLDFYIASSSVKTNINKFIYFKYLNLLYFAQMSSGK